MKLNIIKICYHYKRVEQKQNSFTDISDMYNFLRYSCQNSTTPYLWHFPNVIHARFLPTKNFDMSPRLSMQNVYHF